VVACGSGWGAATAYSPGAASPYRGPDGAISPVDRRPRHHDHMRWTINGSFVDLETRDLGPGPAQGGGGRGSRPGPKILKGPPQGCFYVAHSYVHQEKNDSLVVGLDIGPYSRSCLPGSCAVTDPEEIDLDLSRSRSPDPERRLLFSTTQSTPRTQQRPPAVSRPPSPSAVACRQNFYDGWNCCLLASLPAVSNC
jgi:hypothetical protein